MKILTLSIALLVMGCAEPHRDAPPPPSAAPSALVNAHKAYLDGDFSAVGERLRDVILDPSANDLAKENAYELLDKSYEATKGKLPANDKLPPGVIFVTHGVNRKTSANGTASYRIFVRARLAHDASHVTNVTLRHLPDGAILLDRKSGKGTFDRRDREGDASEDCVIDSGTVDAPPTDGIFTIRIERDDSPPWESWLIAHSLVASTSPELLSPNPSASLSDPHPTVAWVPFRSPELAPFERRNLSVNVSYEKNDVDAWDFWTTNYGDLASVRIGDHEGAPKTRLAPGDYWLWFGASEERTFGPFRLARGSAVARPFHVVP